MIQRTLTNRAMDFLFKDNDVVAYELEAPGVIWFLKHKVIHLALVTRVANRWAVTVMTEEDHPVHYGCPKVFLNLAPETCPNWRMKAWNGTTHPALQKAT
jgi:fructoselysine-6-P-deglycase FrlB-like protein